MEGRPRGDSARCRDAAAGPAAQDRPGRPASPRNLSALAISDIRVQPESSRRPERMRRSRTVRVRPAASLTWRVRVITTRARRLPGRLRDDAKTRKVPARVLRTLTGTRRFVRIFRWLAVATDSSSPLRSFAATASELPETSRLGAATPATRQPPRTPIVTRLVKEQGGYRPAHGRVLPASEPPTAVSCSNCGRPICPECMIDDVRRHALPESSGEQTKVRPARICSAWRRADGHLPAAGASFVLVQLGAIASRANATGRRSPDYQLINDGAVSRPEIADGEIWRLLTAGFLHAELVHLLFNAFALYVLGSLLEPAVGRAALHDHLLRLALRGLVRRAGRGAGRARPWGRPERCSA